MPSKSIISLPFALSSIVVSGPDAILFLQSQLTADMEALEPGLWTPAAWCNPKGRALVVLRVRHDGDAVHLALPEALVESVMKRLNLYRIGRNVTISAGPTLAPNDAGQLQPAVADVPTEPLHRWFLREIETGVPWLVTETAQLFLPQMLGLERIGGLSYRKGCYPGQEIVARVHYRGRVTRRLARFESEAAPLSPGTTVALEQGEGTVLYAVETIGHAAASIGLMVVPADAPAADEMTGFQKEIRMKWALVDEDHAVLPSGA